MDSIVLIMSGIFIKKFDHFMLRYSAIAPFYGITKFDLINKTNYFFFHQSTGTSIRKRRQLLISYRPFYQHLDF